MKTFPTLFFHHKETSNDDALILKTLLTLYRGAAPCAGCEVFTEPRGGEKTDSDYFQEKKQITQKRTETVDDNRCPSAFTEQTAD